MADESDSDLLATLDIVPAIYGARPSKSHYVAYERDLTQADIEALVLPRSVQPKSLMKIHASHHALARALASGMKQVEAALVTGYSPGRVHALLQDPAFKDLVKDYQDEAKLQFADAQQLMANMHLDAMMLLKEKMEEKPEDFTPSMLMDIVKGFADRTGHGPNQEVNLRVQSDFIDRPPRESREDWEKRRNEELGNTEPKTITNTVLDDPALKNILQAGTNSALAGKKLN